MSLYRRTGVFERILVNCTTTFTPRSAYEKMIDILYRTALIDGGATTLITRFGIIAWITSQRLVNPKADVLLSVLEMKIRSACDAQRVYDWSHGGIQCRKEQNDGLDCYEKLQRWSLPISQNQEGAAQGSL